MSSSAPIHAGRLSELLDAATTRLAMASADLATLQNLVPQLAAALTDTAEHPPDPHTVTAGLLRDVLEGRTGIEPLAARLGRPGGSWFLTVLTRTGRGAGEPISPPVSPGTAAALAATLRSGASATPLAGEPEGDLVVIAPYTGAADAVRLAERMRARFAARLGRQLVGCVSEAFTAPADAAVLCRTLRRAVAGFAGSSPDPGAPKVVTADRLRPRLVLAELAEYAQGRATLDDGPLKILRGHDDERGTDFVGSLLAYFDAGCDVTEAAKRLHVHRNTLRYRLQRIEELSGASLSAPLERFTLELQVRVHSITAGTI